VIIIFALQESVYTQSQKSGDVLRAGIAKIDITPEKPVQMHGYGSIVSKGVHDPLSIRVAAFENNDKQLVLVSTDIHSYHRRTFEHIKKILLNEFKLKQSELFLTSQHTHAAPSLTINKETGNPNNFEYTENLKNNLIKVIRGALNTMSPVNIGVGVGYSPIGINRREMRTDRSGSPKWDTGYVKLGRNPYGPTDKEVLVMKLAKPDGTSIAALFDYACHGTCLGSRNNIISGDVLGLAAQFTEKILGKDLIAPVFAGACGNINPWFQGLSGFNTEPGWSPEPVLLGTMLGEEVVQVFRNIKKVSTCGEIKTAFINMKLPGKQVEKPSNRKPEYSGGKESYPPTLLDITAARIGDIAFIGLGTEVCTEIGMAMAIKSASPYKHTFVIICSGSARYGGTEPYEGCGSIGYLAPADLFKEGGYEVGNSPFALKAADMVVKQAIKMLHGL